MTNQEFNEYGREFHEILSKLDDNDLRTLTRMLECTPNYVGDRPQDFYVPFMWTKMCELRNASIDLARLHDGFRLLGLK